MLTVLLITIIFYNHPSTTSVTAYFRTIPILPETTGRVSEIYVKIPTDVIEKGAPIFRLDSSKQEADLEVAKRQIVEIDSSMAVAQADIAAAEGQIQTAKGAYEQALDELDTKQQLRLRNADVVATREIERLQNLVEGRRAGSRRPKLLNRRPRSACPRSFRPKRRLRKPRSSRRRSNSTKRLSTPACQAGWSSSFLKSAISSVRSCGQPVS